MASISIIGGGAFGTAMACVAKRPGHDVLIWAREPEVVAAINRDGINSRYLPDVPLNSGIRATGDLYEATLGHQLILMAVPAQQMRAVAVAMSSTLPLATPVVSCSQGMERGTCKLMPELLAEVVPQAEIGVISGPSFPLELARNLPCAMALACVDWSVGETVAKLLCSPRFYLHQSDDVAGTAIAGVMKNIVAIACGIVTARKLGENARAMMATLGLAETVRLGLAKGAKPETFHGIAGVGDFLATACSTTSRNTSLGLALGEGRPVSEVLLERKEVTEGAFSLAPVATLARQLRVTMPIARSLDGILNHGQNLDEAFALILNNLPKMFHAA